MTRFVFSLCKSIRIHHCLNTHLAKGVWSLVSRPCETGRRARAPMDGFTACLEIRDHAALVPGQVKRHCAKLTHAAPAHPCARGVPFMAQASLSTVTRSHLLLNIKKRAGMLPALNFPIAGKLGTI